MLFYSTNNKAPKVPLKNAVLQSLPPDNGLYMPEVLSKLPESFFENFYNYSFPEMCFQFARTLMNGTIDDEALKVIVYDAVNFESPLVQLDENLSVLELFHGPSLAFKDFGARFMSRLMSHLVKENNNQLDILVATSGDTGGAVALGFYKSENIRVTILYPSGKVSKLQEKQLTTLGHNIRAIEVNGTFDDCQSLVKQAFLDKELNEKLTLSSANSINIARLIPQAFYYLRALQLVKDKSRSVAMCVPSGNFGNITAGIIAKKMGMKMAHFVAATNANNVFTKYLKTGSYDPQPSVATWSNAMDVGNPSNFKRLMDLFDNDVEQVKELITSYSFNDEETLVALKEINDKYNYVACPHTAVAYLGMKQFLKKNPDYQGIFQATAHPSKFIDIVEKTLGKSVEIPETLSVLMDKEKQATFMAVDFKKFKEYLLE
ncbi:UNVERIFIED_CONTAM: hypothetical protein GTU68_002053 [Idotea baltica]|nr:hypothetical protein [Idotea baltica]